MAIVAGAPVCDLAYLENTVKEWERYLAQNRLDVCYFGAEARLMALLGESPEYSTVVLGSQPEWEPVHFVTAIEGDASLRAQLNRATNKGVKVSEWSQEQAQENPKLRKVLNTWLATKGLPTLHFLVEPETLGNLVDRRIWVAELGREPIGFVTLCPVPAQQGWLTEQFVRSPAAPNGTVELLLYHAAKAAVAAHSTYFTMGIVPLLAPHHTEHSLEPVWLRFSRGWAKAHYTRFYNFRGLAEFKTKFHPAHWQPVYVIVKGGRFRFRHLRSIGGAFTGSLPEAALAVGLWRAIRHELYSAFRWVSGSS